jgi:hypothetical protein
VYAIKKRLCRPVCHKKSFSHLCAIVANMTSYVISSSLILVIHDTMIIRTNHIVLACLCRQF